MNHLVEDFLRILTRNPNLALQLSAFLTSTAVVCVAWAVALPLQRHSAHARSLVWRITMVLLLAVAAWRLMPKSTPPVAVVEWRVTLPAAPVEVIPAMSKMPAIILAEKTWWQQGLALVEDTVAKVWLSVAVTLLLWRVVSAYAGLIWLGKHSKPSPEPVKRLLNEMNVPRRFSSRVAERLHSPMLTGWLKPVIWLPPEALAWDEKRLNAVLRHEVAHWRRVDVPWHWLAQITVCLWWWQPLAWHAWRNLRTETEHAADDTAVLAGGDAHDYARMLVEIAAGLPTRLQNVAGLAMFGGEPVRQRVRELMKHNRWRGRIGVGALSLIAILAVILSVLATTKMEFTQKKPLYQSVAKLVAGGLHTTAAASWREQNQDFYGTIIETIESAEMKRRALERVKVLNPNLKGHDVEILATQHKASAIFSVQVRSEDGRYVKVFLDALLDEFIAFRMAIREQTLGKVLQTFLQETVKQQKVMEVKAAALEAFQKENNMLALTDGSNAPFPRLNNLRTQRDELRAEAEEMKLVLGNIAAALAARKQQGRATGEHSPSEIESLYLKTKSELFMLDNERKFLLQTRKPDHAEVVVLDEKIAKAKFMLESLTANLEAELQQRHEAAVRRLAVLDEQLMKLEQIALETGRKLAEHDRLETEAQLAKEAYQKLFERVENLSLQNDIRTDYVAIQERATPPSEVVRNGLIPVWRLWTADPKPDWKEEPKRAAQVKAVR